MGGETGAGGGELGTGGGGGGSGHATSARNATSALALNPAHGSTLFLHSSLAVTIGIGGDAGIGRRLSPPTVHVAGVSFTSHGAVSNPLVRSTDWNTSERTLSLHPAAPHVWSPPKLPPSSDPGADEKLNATGAPPVEAIAVPASIAKPIVHVCPGEQRVKVHAHVARHEAGWPPAPRRGAPCREGAQVKVGRHAPAAAARDAMRTTRSSAVVADVIVVTARLEAWRRSAGSRSLHLV